MSIFRALWRKFAPPLLLGLGILLIGTTGYSIIENWSVFDSVYMTVITIAMVGFSEIHELSHNGRIFTMFIIVAGIGTGGYAIGNLTSFLIGGEARRIFMEGMEERMLARLQNHIVILGYGKFGRAAAKEVRKQGIHVVVIDQSEDRFNLAKREGFNAVFGDATDESLLENVGLGKARGLVAALSEEAANVLAVLTARVLNTDIYIVSRGDEEGSERKLSRAGADRVVLPYKVGGRRMAAMAVQPAVVDFLDVMFSGDELSLELTEMNIDKGSHLIGKTLAESEIREKTGGALIVGIKHTSGEVESNPRGTITLNEGDILIALGKREHLERLKKMAR